jgi:NAD(P)-dependent dehydrogenase (short-subunit alcohol dehydrogenase family)
MVPRSVQFIECDTRLWSSQLALFKSTVSFAPSKGVDIVIANAGVTGPDPLYTLEDPTTEPSEPDLRILNTNLVGVLYTMKLGMHYLRLSPEEEGRDRCFIFKGSIAGILDQPGSFQYSTSKWGLRGLYKSLRRTSWMEGIRVNYVAPW